MFLFVSIEDQVFFDESFAW